MVEGTSTRQRNLLLILRAIDSAGEATAAVLAEQTGLSVATISRGLALLKAKKLIVQLRKDATEVGRRPDIFSINASYGYDLYFWLDGNLLRGYLLDLRGRVAAKCSVEASAEISVPEFLQKLAFLREQLVAAQKRASERILAVNLAIPGLADVNSGVISRIPNYPQFENVNLAAQVQQALGLKCFVHNAARLAAVGEYLRDPEGANNLVYVDITGDCGIGAGIILGGELYEDRNCLAGEIGDMVIDVSAGITAGLGTQGALEREAGLGSVFREARQLLADGHAPELQKLLEHQGTGELNLALLEKAASALDLDVYELLNRTTKAWAAAIVNIVALLAPDAVIVGGAVHSGNRLVEKMVRHHLERMYHRPVSLHFAKKDSGAHVLGAAHLSKRYLFDVILEDIQDD